MKTTSEKTTLTVTRTYFLDRYTSAQRVRLAGLEKKYGKYLYLPLDLPRIEPDDKAAFFEWYKKHAVEVSKLEPDIAGDKAYANRNFLSVNSPNQEGTVWQTNKHDVLTVFPEIREKMKALPFDFSEEPQFSMWSSQRQVMLHRDQTPWEDLPSSLRIMLYDENPKETLFLRERPADEQNNRQPLLLLKRFDETNAFGWNNLRASHGSSFNPEFAKVLMIFTKVKFDLDALEALYERSIQKYGDFAHISKLSTADFSYL